MDWKQAIREERAMLKRIVALLLAFADLAELASGRSLVACRSMLLLLRPAEIIAREFVVGTSDAWPMEVVRSGDARADMVHLAMRLRELACLLVYEAELAFSADAQAGDRSVSQPRGLGRIKRAAAICMRFGLVPSAPAHDTS